MRAVSSALLALLLLCAGVLSGAPAVASTGLARLDGQTPVPTAISVVVTFPVLGQAHFSVTVTTEDGSAPAGAVSVEENGGYWDTIPVSAGVTETDQKYIAPGDHTFVFTYRPNIPDDYLASQTVAATTAPGFQPTLKVVATNSAAGVLSVSAERKGALQTSGKTDHFEFSVDGGEPVEVPFTKWLIPGHHLIRSYDLASTTADFVGLADGPHQVTVTYVPSKGSWYARTTKETTTVLSRTTNPSIINLWWPQGSPPRGGTLYLSYQVVATYPFGASGTLVVTDVTTAKKQALTTVRDVAIYPWADPFHHVLLHGISPGAHRYRATFTPDAKWQGRLEGSSETLTFTMPR